MKTGAIIIVILLALAIRFFPSIKSNNPPARKDIPHSSPNANHSGLNRSQNHLILTRHAKCRMECRHITEAEIRDILHDGTINYNKSQLKDERGPKYAVEGYSHEHTHLRIIFAPEIDDIVVVSCIDLDTEWQCPSCN